MMKPVTTLGTVQSLFLLGSPPGLHFLSDRCCPFPTSSTTASPGSDSGWAVVLLESTLISPHFKVLGSICSLKGASCGDLAFWQKPLDTRSLTYKQTLPVEKRLGDRLTGMLFGGSRLFISPPLMQAQSHLAGPRAAQGSRWLVFSSYLCAQRWQQPLSTGNWPTGRQPASIPQTPPESIALLRPSWVAASALFFEPYFSWRDLAQGGFSFGMQMFMG